MQVDRYRVNEVLEGLAAEFGIELGDDELNFLVEHVVDAFEASTNVVAPLFRAE
jgi:hypothetical protein